MKVLKVIFILLGSFYLLILIAAFFLQHKLLFFPSHVEKNYQYNLTPGDKEVFITTEDGNSINGILYQRPGNKNVILYFHGNGGSLDLWQTASEEILALNCDLLIIDYRGYGKSTGSFSEKGFYDDAHSAYRFLLQNGYSPDQIIVCGRSLGSGVAAQLAHTEKVKALILQSPYTSLPDVAAEKMPYLLPRLLISYQLNTLKIAPDLKVPVLILHGTNDEVIPSSHGQKIYDAVKAPRKLVLIKGAGHNDLDHYSQHAKAADEFIKGLNHP